MDLEWILNTDDDSLMQHFQGSPIRRPGPTGLKRNAATVLGNLRDPAARPALLHARTHADESVRHAALWALDRI